MFEGSKYLLVDDLALICEKIIIRRHMTVKNCIFLWNIACKYPNSPKLTTNVEQFLEKSLPDVMLDESFLSMEVEKVCQMMRIESIEASRSPDERFRAAFAWLEHDAVARRSFSGNILSTIPLTPGKISRQALKKASSSKALTEEAKDTLLELLTNSLAVAEFLADPDFIIAQASSSPTDTISSNCFSTFSQPDIDMLFCNSANETKDGTILLKYHVSSKTWRRLKSLPCWQQFGGACVVRDRLTLFGGCIAGDSSFGVAEYDTWSEDDDSSSSWHTDPACHLPYASSYWAACGGGDGGVRGDTAYVCAKNTSFFEYTPLTKNRFQTKPPMAVGRYGKSMTVSPTFDAVYVAGGRNDASNRPKREIEKFNIADDAWQTVGVATSDRFCSSSAMCGEDLYLIAGDEDNKSVEKFNIRTGKASVVPDLITKRKNSQSVVLYNNVICVFGDDHASVEAYDVREGRWTTGVVVPDMPFAVLDCSLAWK